MRSSYLRVMIYASVLKRGPCTVKAVWADLITRNKLHMHNNFIRLYLMGLCEDGHLKCSKIGRSLVFEVNDE